MADFEDERARARELLADESVTAFYVGALRGDVVETASARLADGDRSKRIQELSLLAAHIQLVANQTGAEVNEIAASAAAAAGQFEGRAFDEPTDDDEQTTDEPTDDDEQTTDE